METERPDLVVSDLMMTQLGSGFSLAERIKHDAEFGAIPVILLTNFSANEGVRDGFDLGAEEYLIKSHFTPSEVLRKVESVLEKSVKDGILEEEKTSDETVSDSPKT